MSDPSSIDQPPVDPDEYRSLIGLFATGVGIVTARYGDRRYAMTANSITSASTDPLLVLVSFMRESDTGKAVSRSGRFGLSVLETKYGRAVARHCASKHNQSESVDQLADLSTCEGPHGIPLINGALECLTCIVEQTHSVGDHDVAFGRATRVPECQGIGEPLIFYDSQFWQLDQPAR